MQIRPDLISLKRGATLAILMALGIIIAGPLFFILLVPTQFGYLHDPMESVPARFEGKVIGPLIVSPGIRKSG